MRGGLLPIACPNFWKPPQTQSDIQTFKILEIMLITNESMQVLKAGKATVSGSYKVGQVVTFKCGDGSTQKARCTHAYFLNANMPVGEFKPCVEVQFRKFKGEIIAVFPYEICGRDTVTSYAHNGQHSACDWNINCFSQPAKPEEYAPLLAELEKLGYTPYIIKRRSHAKYLQEFYAQW